MINMNEYVAEQMSRGIALSDMVRELEKAYHSENIKRQEQEKLATQINASLERAAAATADYFNTVTESTEFNTEMFKEILTELADSAQLFIQVKTKAKEKENAAAQTRGIMNPTVEVVHNRVEDKEAEDMLMKFLFDMGLVKHVD